MSDAGRAAKKRRIDADVVMQEVEATRAGTPCEANVTADKGGHDVAAASGSGAPTEAVPVAVDGYDAISDMQNGDDKPQEPIMDRVCLACADKGGSSGSMAMVVCDTCGVCVHWQCYYGVTASGDAMTKADRWSCDRCRHAVARVGDGDDSNTAACVHCLQSLDALMRHVDISASEDPRFSHLLCLQWASSSLNMTGKTVVNEEAGTTIKAVSNDSLEKDTEPNPLAACCFCRLSKGTLVRCRRLYCGRAFHARCAYLSTQQTQGNPGYIEMVTTPFPLRRAYCDRHGQCRDDVSDVLTLLTSKFMAGLLPRDVHTKLCAISRRMRSYQTIDELLVDIVAVLVEQCHRGYRRSKNDPPTYCLKHLQALQLVVDHFPQLRRVYDRSTMAIRADQFVADPEIRHILQKTFNPSRFVRQFAGPLQPNVRCDVCHEPFQERQHVFYCGGADSGRIHCQHWGCTTRNRTGGLDAKTLKLVQHGVWTDLVLPQGFPVESDVISCGACRARVDVRGLIIGRPPANPSIGFEEKASAFMFGGCFLNRMPDQTSLVVASSQLSRGRRSMPNGEQQRKDTKRGLPATSSIKSKTNGNQNGGDAAVDLVAPKLERINVRRTTRWLACVNQVVKLVVTWQREQDLPMHKTSELVRETVDANLNDNIILSESQNKIELEEVDVEKFEPAMNGQANDAGAKNGEEKVPNIDTTSAGEGNPGPPEESLKDLTNDTALTSQAVREEAKDVVRAADESSKEISSANPSAGAAPAGTDQDLPPPPTTTTIPVRGSSPRSTCASEADLPALAVAYLEEAKKVVRPYDTYALYQLESAHEMLAQRKGPGLSILHSLIQEYTRYLYVKHTRALEKARNEQRKRQALEAQQARERERTRIDREAELALKKQMMAMRKKQRQQLKGKSTGGLS